MICLVLALNLDLKMSSKLTSICDSDHSDSPPSVISGAGVFDNLRELSEESMAPTEIWDINKTYNGFKSVRVIEPPCTRAILVSISLDLVAHVTSASRKRQASHVWHENVTQSPNPFQHYSKGLGNFTSLPSASQMLSMLTWPHRLPDETLTLPPISVLTTPYAFTPLPLPSLRLHSALQTCLQHSFPSLRSCSALPTCLQQFLPSLRLRSALPTCL
ncbi:hypothetical protein O181_097692 [Austropuccinia psidii MF-1]|uniref:Uncharacterized protein n=1 Tax=Austropuccinia psidii MF-1 TaxID=1389203 RepID=A0A9Q3PER8_9BASI|nr:hypothetical protein [Austropuccinia psidii MF-1]